MGYGLASHTAKLEGHKTHKLLGVAQRHLEGRFLHTKPQQTVLTNTYCTICDTCINLRSDTVNPQEIYKLGPGGKTSVGGGGQGFLPLGHLHGIHGGVLPAGLPLAPPFLMRHLDGRRLHLHQ